MARPSVPVEVHGLKCWRLARMAASEREAGGGGAGEGSNGAGRRPARDWGPNHVEGFGGEVKCLS